MRKFYKTGLLCLCFLFLLCGCSSDKTEGKTLHARITIDCGVILNNNEALKDGKAEFVPADGKILSETEVELTEGDTVFDVLREVCLDSDIQMESSYTPLYKSYYVEGINNLYEFDCGANSGWMYSVNGQFPNYGCSAYEVKEGDRILWQYTCDLGSDIGGDSNLSK